MGVPLVESKLSRPRLRARIVGRPRVTAALERAAEHGVVLVSAPAGYGKTVAVADWLRDRRAAWVSLDEADNDPVRLWTYAAAALGTELRGGPLEAQIDALGARELPLVLEDVHVLSDPVCVASLAHAARVFGRLVLITRADPAIRVPRLRAEGRLGEVRAETLAFTVREASRVLDGRGSAREIVARTEGWPAAVYLVALWLRDGGDAERLPTRHLSEYVGAEVLDGLDAPVREFLERSAVLWRLSAELCDHVLEIDDAADRLNALVRANLFVAALDDHAGWFRYHDLFRELLLRTLPDEEAAALHRRAADWFQGRGRIEEAVEHANAAGDHATVAALADTHHVRLLRTGRGATFVRWLGELPEQELAEWPGLLVAGAMAAAGSARDRAEVRRLLAAADRARTAHPETWTLYHEAVYDLVVGVISDDDVPTAAAAAERAVALSTSEPETSGAETSGAETSGAETSGAETSGAETSGGGEPGAETRGGGEPGARTRGGGEPGAETRGGGEPGAETRGGGEPGASTRGGGAEHEASVLVVTALAALAAARLLAGDEADAVQAAVAAIGHPTASRRPHGFASALATLAIVRADQGRFAAAREHVDQAIGIVKASGNAGARTDGRAHAADAIVSLGEGRFGRAVRAGEHAAALLPPGALRARVLLDLARTHVRRGELPRAEAALHRAQDVLADCRDAGIVPRLAERVAYELASARDGALAAEPIEPISSAERLVLAQLPGARTNAEIATELYLSPNTVKTHLRSIYRKLGAHSREEAVARAQALGLLDSPR